MKNQKYVEQLIEDIKGLQEIEPPWEKGQLPDEVEEQMLIMEDAMMHNKGVPVSEFSKISREMLPPKDVLTEDQSAALCRHLMDLLQHCNFYPDFPSGYREASAYYFIREYWDNFILPFYPYNTHYQFCNYDITECPFPDYCTNCLDAETNESQPEENKDLPGKVTFYPGAVKITMDENDAAILRQKETIKALMKKPAEGNFIAGIYNYCDRWCARCQKKQHCSLNAMEKEIPRQKNLPPEMESFINIQASVMATKEILEEEDISLVPEQLHDLAAVKKSREYRGTALKIIKKSRSYADSVHHWSEKLEKKYEYDREAREMIRIIMWYYLFIHAKLSRALMDIESFGGKVPVDSDQNGSAKVALMGIDSSREAWINLMWMDCRFEVDGEMLVEELNELEGMVRGVFPGAEGFRRPGLD